MESCLAHLFCICIDFDFLSLQISTAFHLPRSIGSVNSTPDGTSLFQLLRSCMLWVYSSQLISSFP